MPVSLEVIPKLNDAAARETAKQATKAFDDLGKSISKSVGGDISRGLDDYSKAFGKAADQAGKLRVAEERLNEVRDKGITGSRLTAQMEKVESLRRAEARAVGDATAALDRYQASAKRANDTAGAGIFKGVADGARQAFSDAANSYGVFGRQAESAMSSLASKGGMAATGVAAVGLAAVVAGKQLYDLGAQWDDIADGISGKTGKIGDDLASVTNSVKNLAGSVASPIGDIADVAASVSQATNLSGADLENLTRNITDFQRVSGQQVDVRGLGKAFRIFDVTDAKAQVDALNTLANTSWSTGAPISALIDTLNGAGKSAKQFGFDIGQTAGLLATFEAAGLDFTKIESSLTKALKTFAAAGRDPADALRETVIEIQNLLDAGREAAATDLASKTFGKGFTDVFEAIKSGKLDVDALSDSLKGNQTTIEDVTASTADFAEEWQKFKNNISAGLEPIATGFFTMINGKLTEAVETIKAIPKGFEGIGTAWDELTKFVAGKPLAFQVQQLGGASARDANGNIVSIPQPPALSNPLDAIAGAPGSPSGPASTNPLDILQGATTGQTPGAPAAGPTVDLPGIRPNSWGQVGPGIYGDWYNPDQYKPGKNGGRPDAPVPAYKGDPMELLGGMPATSALYGAAGAVLDARQAQAQARAKLDQLEKDNTATESELQDARNDLAKKDRENTEAEMRLTEAKQTATDKSLKQMNGAIGDLNAIFAPLDQDFGISKGIPGLVENLTKMFGNMALAGAISSSPTLQGAAMALMNPQTGAASGSGYGSYGTGFGSPTGGGQPYGLPAGTNTGGYGSGGKGIFPDWVQQVGAAFGVTPSTYSGHQETDRNEAGYAPNPNHENRGIDWTGSPQAMQAFADYLKTVPGMEQVIWNGAGQGTGDTVEIAGGRSQPGYFADDLAGHGNHVHTRQSSAIPLPGGFGAAGYTQNSGTVPVNVVNGPSALMNGSGLSADQWGKIAGAESSGNWAANTGNGFSGGLQFQPSTWDQFGGQQYAPQAWQATPDQQMAVGNNVFAGQGPGAWPATSAAHPEWFQPGAGGAGLPAIPAGAGGGQGYMGLGGPPAAGGAGAGGFTPGGVAPQGATGGGGIGITPGGSLDSVISGAASMLPGGGAAAQVGIKLASRAIQYAGQVAGIGASGLAETFLPSGSPLGNFGNSWFGKLAGGFAGARPAKANMAGQGPPPLSAQEAQAKQAQGQPGGPPGQGGSPITVNYTNNQASEDRAGKDLTNHLSNMNATPGPGNARG